MGEKSSAKTDEMRRIREENFKKRMARRDGEETPPRPPAAAIDNRVNEKLPTDPNGRGGKTKIKVPKRSSLVKPRRDEFPVPAPVAAGEGTCTGCNKIRATRNGKIVTHSWPLPTRQVCPGAGKPPKEG